MADKFGQGATGKAISTRFERAKKEPAWDLSINREADGGSATKATPRSRQPKAKKATSSNEDDEEESNFDETPSKKKTPLNKVQGARIQKANGSGRGRKATKIDSYAEQEDEELEFVKGEDEVEEQYPVHGNGNGYGGHEEMEAVDYYAVAGGEGEVYYDDEA